jgi:hypothetical protein
VKNNDVLISSFPIQTQQIPAREEVQERASLGPWQPLDQRDEVS